MYITEAPRIIWLIASFPQGATLQYKNSPWTLVDTIENKTKQDPHIHTQSYLDSQQKENKL